MTDLTISSLSDKVYEIENGKKFIVSAVPVLNSFNTTFSFMYWTDGTKNADAKIFTTIDEHKKKVQSLLQTGESSFSLGDHVKSNQTLYIGIGAGLAVVICLVVGIRWMRARRASTMEDNKVNPNLLDDTMVDPSPNASSNNLNSKPNEVDFYSNKDDGNVENPFSKNGKTEIERL